MDLKHELVKYPNGLRVLMIPMPKSQVVYYETQILAGSYYETAKEIETAHFLEHLNGQFTSKKYPSARKTTELLDKLGVQHNAYVTEYISGYHLFGQRQNAQKIFDILAQALVNFQMDKRVFKQEQNSILEELTEHINNHWYPIEQRCHEILFPDHPGSRSVQGSIDNVVKLHELDLIGYRKRLYQPDRILMILAGDLSLSAMKQLIKDSGLAKLSTTPCSLAPPPFTAPQNPLRVYPKDKSVPREELDPKEPVFVKADHLNGADASQIIMLWRVPITTRHPDRFPLAMICHVLTGGMGGQLMIKLRTDMGLIYSINCQAYLDPQNPELSYLQITTNTQGRHLKKVSQTILQEIRRLGRQLVSPESFKSVDNQIKLEMLNHQFKTDPQNYAEQYSQGILWGQPGLTFEEIYKAYDKVTRTDIRRVAKEYLSPEKVITVYSARRPIKF